MQPRARPRSRSTTTASRCARPCSATCARRDYDVVYLGYNVDGRIGRINLDASAYGAVRLGPAQRLHRPQRATCRASSSPPSRRSTSTGSASAAPGLFASGDGDPYDDVERGFDAIFENPIFAGADTSYWIRQTIPFAGGGRAVSINGRNGILNSLRSSKEQGQSQLRQSRHDAARRRRRFRPDAASCACRPTPTISGSSSTAVLEDLRMQGTIRRDIGWDLSRGGDLAAARDPEPRLPPVGRGAAEPAPASATCSRI